MNNNCVLWLNVVGVFHVFMHYNQCVCGRCACFFPGRTWAILKKINVTFCQKCEFHKKLPTFVLENKIMRPVQNSLDYFSKDLVGLWSTCGLVGTCIMRIETNAHKSVPYFLFNKTCHP